MSDTSGSRRLRVGVTGHRTLADPDAVGAAVDAVLERWGEGGAVALTAVSSLAEGADRLVAWRIVNRTRGRLAALLPFAPDEYASDFAAEASRQEFNELLAAADEVQVIDARPDDDGTREAAYERACLAVIDRCDLLVALWDGGPSRGRGGTADLVAEARIRSHPLVIVPVERAAP